MSSHPAAVGADQHGEVAGDTLRALGGCGLFGLVTPEEFGGAGLGLSGLVVAAEVACGCA
jgi:butyryl-CoA dehydrogenase